MNYTTEHVRRAKRLLGIPENGVSNDDALRLARTCQSRGISDKDMRDALNKASAEFCPHCGRSD